MKVPKISYIFLWYLEVVKYTVDPGLYKMISKNWSNTPSYIWKKLFADIQIAGIKNMNCRYADTLVLSLFKYGQNNFFGYTNIQMLPISENTVWTYVDIQILPITAKYCFQICKYVCLLIQDFALSSIIFVEI